MEELFRAILVIPFSLWIYFTLSKDFFKYNVSQKIIGMQPITFFDFFEYMNGFSTFIDFSKFEPINEHMTEFDADFRKLNNAVVGMRISAFLTILALLSNAIRVTFF